MFRVTSCIIPHAPLEGLAAWITIEQNGGAPVNVTVYSTESGALSVPGWKLSPAWRTALTAAINRANTRPDTRFHRETEHDFTRRAAAWRRNQEVQRRQEVERQTILRQEAEREAVQRSRRTTGCRQQCLRLGRRTSSTGLNSNVAVITACRLPRDPLLDDPTCWATIEFTDGHDLLDAALHRTPDGGWFCPSRGARLSPPLAAVMDTAVQQAAAGGPAGALRFETEAEHARRDTTWNHIDRPIR